MEDKCKTCAHNMDKSTLDCEYACAGVTQTDGDGIVFACDDYKAAQKEDEKAIQDFIRRHKERNGDV